MADEYEEEISNEEKVKIASDFILHAPPGEFNEVFNDVRVLLSNDQLLKEGASGAFAQYNQEQFTPVKLEDVEKPVIISAHGLQRDGAYLDPASEKTFRFDHLRKEASDIQEADVSFHQEKTEEFRKVFQTAVQQYCEEHYPHGVTTTYAREEEVIVCLEDHKFQPNNFWNGRWRSEWIFHTGTGDLKGLLRVQVHYYEDGNVQLQTHKKINKKLAEADPKTMSAAFIKTITSVENEYQTAISENYNTMSDTTFKALRRALPITRTKLDWNKILNYKIGKELSNSVK